MFQIKMFRAVSRNGFEDSINKFLQENSKEIKNVIDIKINSSIKEGKNADYIGMIIYEK